MADKVTFEDAVAMYEDMFGSVPIIILQGRGFREDKIDMLLDAVDAQVAIVDLKDAERINL